MRNKNAECRNIFVALIVALLLAFAGCNAASAPALTITGDCEGYSLTANASLGEAIALAGPRAEEFDILLVGGDGLIARISGEDMDGCELVYSEENAWEVKSELHPRSVRVKELALVAVVRSASEETWNLLRLLKEEGTSTKNGRGVTVYTTRMITEAYHDALRFLGQGERVMIVELDGLGWEMLQRAEAPYMKALEPGRAMAAYPPDSKTGLAALLHIDGDTDLFTAAQALGKTCAYIEGSHVPVGSGLRPVLSISDEEVYTNAREALKDSPDLIFAHFHGIDDIAQDYGPYARETRDKIEEIDDYVRVLVEGFDGRVVITADHGLHETEEGGAHGVFLAEDMIVPYIVK